MGLDEESVYPDGNGSTSKRANEPRLTSRLLASARLLHGVSGVVNHRIAAFAHDHKSTIIND